MKIFEKILMTLCISMIFCTSFINVQAQNEKTNIEQSYLIEKYLISHKDNIIDFSKKYKFQNDTELKSKLGKIDFFIQSLRALQNDGEKSGINVPKILKDIKIVNEDIRILLLKKKIEYDKLLSIKKETYQNLGKNLSVQLDNIYSKMYDASRLDKSNLSEKEKIIKNSLASLNILSKEMYYFGLKEFDTEEEMQTSFLGALNSIKYHILIIKENLN